MHALFSCFGVNRRVDLPPRRSETETSKLLTMDHEDAVNHDNGDSHDRSKLNIEEFECGVHFECSENAKQEWAFTLYDFDGHGRITKEDLASLLKALYDAVGSSIKLPPNGAKTLKLRLTVGQESVSHLQNPNIKLTERSKTPNKASKHKVREFSRLNNLARAHVKRTNENQAQRVVNQESTPTTTQAEEKIVNSQPGTVSHVSGPEHQHLLDLVHENLAQNQGRPLRKHQNNSRNDTHNRHKRQHRTAAPHCPTTCAVQSTAATPVATSSQFTETATNSAPKESQDRRDYYLDLAGVECNSAKVLNNVCLPTKGSSYLRTGNGKNKLRSRDVSVKATNGLVLSNDHCDVPPRLPKEKCNISSRLAREKCDVSSRLQQEKCSISQHLTQERCGISSNLTQEKCGISSNLTQEMCGMSSNVTQEKCGISSNLTQEKCGISLNLIQEKCEIASRLSQEKCGISSNLMQDRCDISQHVTQEKCGISQHLTQEKCGISSHLSQEKFGISSRMMKEKCGISSLFAQGKCGISVSMNHDKCEISSPPPLKKCDLASRLLQGKCDVSLGFLQEKGDISLCLPQEKRDEGSRLTPAKCDMSSPLPRDKCDVNSRTLQEKPALTSRLQQGTCDISSRLPLGKCDNLVRQEGERTASKQPQGLPNNQHLRSKSSDLPENPQASKSAKPKKPKGWLNFNGGRFRPASLPGKEPVTVLPDCHRRHRHREKDRDVMMQQVAEWIEREHVDGAAAGRVMVQRHEHHHIHEHHHHHHFHHHHDT